MTLDDGDQTQRQLDTAVEADGAWAAWETHKQWCDVCRVARKVTKPGPRADVCTAGHALLKAYAVLHNRLIKEMGIAR